MTGAPNPPLAWHRPSGAVWVVAGSLVALELAVSARYGFHRDELYFLAAGTHPATGFVDEGPLAPMLARLSTVILGGSPTAIRVLPALAGGVTVLAGGRTARALGGGRFAQVLAALGAACAPVTLGASHLAGTTAYDLAAWSLAILVVVDAVVLRRPRRWLWAGVIVGVDLENKDLVLLLVVALFVGLLATETRGLLATPWPWLGLVAAGALWLPNLLWQLTHGLPAVAMDSALRAEHSAPSDYAGFVPAQLVLGGLLAVPIVAVGAVALARDRSLRFVAVAGALVLVFVAAVIPGRPYYTAGFLPVLLAAGAVRVEDRVTNRTRRRLWRGAPVVGALLSLPFVLPLLPEAAAARIPDLHKISYDLGETVGWPQLVDTVAVVYHHLPADQRRGTSLFTANYGEAGALEWYGPALGLPVPLSGHNTYWLWGPGRAPDATVITVGAVDQLRPHFARCRYDATFHSPHDFDNDENGVTIWTCTGPDGPWRSFWGSLRHYG